MTLRSFEVFKWSGTSYNNTYKTSYKAEIEDDDGSFQARGDSSEKISIDGGSFEAPSSKPYAIDIGFTDTDTDGASHVETCYFLNTGGDWYFTPGPGSDFTVGATLGTYQSHTSTGWDCDDAACFASGTLIETMNGPVAVEALVPGALVKLERGGFSPVRLCLSRPVTARELAVNPRLKPVRISAGALGQGLPTRDLLVSRQHRMLVRSRIARRMFGGDVLVAAIKLTTLPGIFIEQKTDQVIYFHLLFDQHEVVIAEGAPSESYFVTPRSLAMMTPEARQEYADLFPDMAGQSIGGQSTGGQSTGPHSGNLSAPACPIPSLSQQKNLIARHRKNAKPLLIQ